MEDLVLVLNESLKKSSLLLSVISNAPSGELTKSISVYVIDLVSSISASLQRTSDISEELKRQTKCAKDALEAVQSLQKLVKVQKSTIDGYQFRQSNRLSTGVMTDVMENPICQLCIANKQTIDTLVTDMKLRTDEYKSKEQVAV